jgi:hypothetical protein
MWAMVFSIRVQGGQWLQIQDNPAGRDDLHMRFESREECAQAGLERDVKLIEAGSIAQFKCVEHEAEKLE